MKIEFDKALLWLPPYLYLVSIMYYWGFWETFQVDAFSYYSATDIVKGITSPIIPALIFSVGISLFCHCMRAFFDYVFNTKSTIQYKIKLIRMSFAAILIFLVAYPIYNIKKGISPLAWYSISSNYKYYLALIIPALILLSVVINRAIYPESGASPIPKWWIIFLVFLPGLSFNSGKKKSLQIFQNRAFDYILADSLATPKKDIYKYLGKTGDYHILTTNTNIKIIVVHTDEIKPLIIEHFSLEDSASISRFKLYQNQLTTTRN